MTRALKKLIDYKNTAAMAISILTDELEEEWDGNIFAEDYYGECMTSRRTNCPKRFMRKYFIFYVSFL